MQQQIKSRQRVTEHGEVFTAEREVKAMCDLVKQETERIDSRFLEPACGTGNFLTEILARKLAVVKSEYGRSPLEYEKYSLLAVSSLYGVDIMADNVETCRERLYKQWDKQYKAVCKKECNDDTRKSVRFTYTGIDMHRNDKEIGGWDTAIRKDEYKKLFYNQQESMNAPQHTEATEDIAELKKEVTRSSAVKSVQPSGKSTAANPITPPLVTEKFGIKSPVPKAALPVPDRKRSNTPDFDESSITVGMTVIHKKFGEGKVQSIADKHIYVKFADSQKNFTFPDAFTGGFLHLPK